MAAISETGPDTRNSIARLWRDKETRSFIIQIVTLVVILTAVALILRNVVINLEAVGKEFSFDFFFYPAGYDITFSLVCFRLSTTARGPHICRPPS